MGYKLDAHNLLFPIPQNQIEIVNDKTILLAESRLLIVKIQSCFNFS